MQITAPDCNSKVRFAHTFSYLFFLCFPIIGDSSSSDGDSLRRILEDYLEIEPHSNSAISQLLSPALLSRYFKRVIYASRDLIFDIDQAADEVLVAKCMYDMINSHENAMVSVIRCTSSSKGWWR